LHAFPEHLFQIAVKVTVSFQSERLQQTGKTGSVNRSFNA
jgi:hypothetical protein